MIVYSVLGCIIAVLSSVITGGGLHRWLALREREDTVCPEHGKWVLRIFLGCGVIGALSAWIHTLSLLAVLTTVAAALGAMICVLCFRQMLVFDGECVVRCALFGREKSLRYDEMIGYCKIPLNRYRTGLLYYTADGYITVDPKDPRTAAFLDVLKEGYRRTHGGEELPETARPAHLLMQTARRLALVGAVAVLVGGIVWLFPSAMADMFPEPTQDELEIAVEEFDRLQYNAARKRNRFKIITDQNEYYIAGTWDEGYVRRMLTPGTPLTIRYYYAFDHIERYAEVVAVNGTCVVFYDNNGPAHDRFFGIIGEGLCLAGAGFLLAAVFYVCYAKRKAT